MSDRRRSFAAPQFIYHLDVTKPVLSLPEWHPSQPWASARRRAQPGLQVGFQAFARKLRPGCAPALEAHTLRLPAVMSEGHVGASVFIARYLEPDCGPEAFVLVRFTFGHALPFPHLARRPRPHPHA